MIFISLDILLKGNESISFVLFLIFFKFIIFDVEEDKNFGKIFIKNVSLLKKKKNVVKIFFLFLIFYVVVVLLMKLIKVCVLR